MSFSAEQAKIIQYLYGTTSLLSIVGSLFIITNFLHFKTFKTTTLTLIFFLGLSDFGNAIFNSLIFFIFSPTFESASYNLCQAQAIGTQYFALSSFFWTSVIAFHVWRCLATNLTKVQLKKLFKYYLVICITIPLITVIIGVSKDVFGEVESNAWCWIKFIDNGAYRIGLYYGILLLLWIFNIVMYILISRSLNNLPTDQSYREKLNKMRLYLLVFILCKLPAVINRMYNLDDDKVWFPLFVVQSISDGLFGFFDSLVFVIIRKHFFYNHYCSCCSVNPEMQTLRNSIQDSKPDYSSLKDSEE